MKKKELYEQVTAYFMQAMPEAETELHYDSPFQLLVAVILSAQCTDKRVNTVTPRLFEDYPTAEAMALATPEVIYDYVKSVSYPNNKARHLVGMAQMLLKGDMQGVMQYMPMVQQYGGYRYMPVGYQDVVKCIQQKGNVPGSPFAAYAKRMMQKGGGE